MDKPRKRTVARAYGELVLGLQAAIDLLEQEAGNEISASEVADREDETAAMHAHYWNAEAYRQAITLLQEQMILLGKG